MHTANKIPPTEAAKHRFVRKLIDTSINGARTSLQCLEANGNLVRERDTILAVYDHLRSPGPGQQKAKALMIRSFIRRIGQLHSEPRTP